MTNNINNNNNIYRVADLPQNRPTHFELSPAPAIITALVDHLDLLELRKLSFSGELRASGHSDWTLEARLGATVVQPCIVTLDPVTTRIETNVVRRFLLVMPEVGEALEEIEMPEDDNADLLGSHIDIGLVLHETLALNLPIYPRVNNAKLAESVFSEPGKQAMTDEDTRPFARLATLRDKLEQESEK